ncbi:iron-sulfur cluster assembly scaffold protein [Desulfogranum marinum]|uniref:iron-sulfur cluster assembly scaffold protein n=1 Tax=Desulfogranum marinum TaxID=453220 RepID=UPI00196546FC|nr:iron-sulfur cluster assembly scaffold protein [Desulfogranum marinum]MBM9514305.1 iron-sulfur cluster assembly scaffold protein [Desulfogranum marinum]
MNDEQFNAMVDSIQEQVFEDAKDAYGVVGFDRWRNPRFHGRMEDADVQGRITGSCGDTMEMFLKIEEDRVTDASYATDGCGSSNVCGSFAAEIAIGKTVEEIFDLTGEDVLNKIGQFPEQEEHCAYLAIKTVQDAVNNYMVKKVQSS